jgi:integrase
MRQVNTRKPKKSWFITAKAVSGIPDELTIHDLRHTAASLAVSSGANVKVVQKMLGHKSAAMTLDIYADLFDEDLESVAIRLDEARSQQIVANLLPISAQRVLRTG